jgi:hypothetical protein
MAVLGGIAALRLGAERLHTGYDPELGWVSTPGLALPNLYRPGVGLHTNAQGFRGRRDTEASAQGRRIVCSGDSFTLGFGVGDEETWCHLLSTYEGGVETVNMGQGGYGADQAYLWYRRDGTRLQHQLLVFAFIAEDLERMGADSFFGFGKPYLALQGGRLVTRNVPVPRGPYRVPWLTAVLPRIYQLHTLALLRGLYLRLAPPPSSAARREVQPELVYAMFEDLRELSRAKGSALALVYLPTLADCLGTVGDPWRLGLGQELARRGFTFFDLTPEFRSLPPAAVDRLFLPGPGLGRHYSADGHRLVATLLHERLRALHPRAELATSTP